MEFPPKQAKQKGIAVFSAKEKRCQEQAGVRFISSI